MSRKKLISLVISIGLLLALVLSACAPAETTTPTTPTAPTTPATPTTPSAPQVVTQQVDKVYKVLSAQGSYIPVECKPLAPRIDGLAGKRILFYEAEATNMQMPTLLARLQKDYPTATFDVVYTEVWGETVPTEAYLKCQASIRGVGW